MPISPKAGATAAAGATATAGATAKAGPKAGCGHAPLRVSYNALALQPQGTGVQTYARELLRSIAPLLGAPPVAAVRLAAVGELPPGTIPLVRRSRLKPSMMLDQVRHLGFADLVHGLDAHIPLDNPFRLGERTIPMVATVHDLAVFDVPWAFRLRRLADQRMAIMDCVRRADGLVAVSSFTAERIKRRFGREAAVTPLAPAEDMAPQPEPAIAKVRQAYLLPERFILYVGSLEPRKDVETLAKACRHARLELVVAGKALHCKKAIPASRVLGYVPRSDLPALYSAAGVVAYPSYYEGFGLPPLEAMACGTPVVAYNIPALAESLGDAAILTRPGDEHALASSLSELMADQDHREHLQRAGIARSRTFSWDRTASATLALYRDLLGRQQGL